MCSSIVYLCDTKQIYISFIKVTSHIQVTPHIPPPNIPASLYQIASKGYPMLDHVNTALYEIGGSSLATAGDHDAVTTIRQVIGSEGQEVRERVLSSYHSLLYALCI